MEPRSRFAVPVEELASSRVDLSEQVQEQAEARPPGSSDWGMQLPAAYGTDGADADGD